MKRIFIPLLLVLLTGCIGIGSTTRNTMYPNWNYIRSDAPEYTNRDANNEGNCVDYADRVYTELKAKGCDVELWRCRTPQGYHRAVLMDGKKVYSVGEPWVFNKGRHDWEWVRVTSIK